MVTMYLSTITRHNLLMPCIAITIITHTLIRLLNQRVRLVALLMLDRNHTILPNTMLDILPTLPLPPSLDRILPKHLDWPLLNPTLLIPTRHLLCR
jgi:hypothetical protein